MIDEQENLEIPFLICLRKLRKSNVHGIFRSLSTAEFFTLFAIQKRLSETVETQKVARVSVLTESLSASPQALSKMLRTMEGKGYLKRITDPADRRSTFVAITPQGDALLADARKSVARFAQLVTEKMGSADMAEFIRLSEKCADIMDEVADEIYKETEEAS